MQPDAQRLGTGLQHGEGLRQRVRVDHEHRVRLGPARPADQRHRLGGGGRLVQHRGAGDRQAGQVGDHRLEVDQRLEPALADLGLVGRVGRVPGRVLQDVALDDRRGDRAAVAQSDHRGEHLVGRGPLAELGQHGGLVGGGGQVERGPVARRPRGRRRRRARRARGGRQRPASARCHRRAGRCAGAANDPCVDSAESAGRAPVRSATARTVPAAVDTSGHCRPPRGGPPRACERWGRERVLLQAEAARRRRRWDSSSSACGPPSSRSAGSSASSPESSRSAPETAMPKTPWPPASRSTTSSAEVHS